jgi:hypothetical protein
VVTIEVTGCSEKSMIGMEVDVFLRKVNGCYGLNWLI